MADANTETDRLLVEDMPAAFSGTQPAGAPFSAAGQPGAPGEGAAGRRARRTPARPQRRSRGVPQLLLILLVVGLLARMRSYREPAATLSSDEDQETQSSSQPAPGAPPDSAPSLLPLFAPPAATGQALSAPGAVSSAVDVPTDEPRATTVPPGQSPAGRLVPQWRPRPGPARHRLHIRAKEEARLLITIDGQRTIDFLLRPGQTMHWSAQRDFTLTSRNGGEVDLTLNGHPLLPLGNSGPRVRYIRPAVPTRDARQSAQEAARPS
jgi:Domain of unknown function (DUF4115)